jgi:hypothetical protein
MDIVEEKIFSCTVVMSQINQKKQGFSHLLCLKFAHFLFIIIQDLEIKNQRNPLQGWLYLMSSNVQLFTQ